MKTVFSLLFAGITFSSCQKEINFDAPAAGSQACKACSYVPFCDGSVYVYSDTTIGIASDVTETLDIVGDTTIDNKIFQKFSNPGADGYYNCTAGVSTIIAFNIPAPGGNLPRVEQTLLKANAAVGTTWSNSFPVGLGIADYAFTIAAKGLTRTVLGITYNDVTYVRMILSTSIPGGGTLVAGEYDYFYANNVGLIENIAYSSPLAGPRTIIYHRVLKTYSIP